ncbi:MAG TPA: hypothetical protein VMW43_12065 [Bacteroidota bacterium]|nr:hypothetical protein [Bacteroidota bacterium]
MKQTEVVTVLKSRIANANKDGKGYVLPKSYNHIWALELQNLIDKKMAKEIKSKDKKKGVWLK